MKKQGINYIIDKRTTLLGIVEVLALENTEYKVYFQDSYSKYYDLIHEHFNNFSEHILIKEFKELLKQGTYFGNSYILQYDENFNFIQEKAKENDILLNTFLQYIKDFIKVSKFENFYEKNLPLFSEILKNNISLIKSDYLRIFKDFYGINDFNLFIVLKLNQGSWGETVQCSDKTYNICGVDRIENDIPIFFDDTVIRNLIFHESTHPIVGKIVDENIESICKSEGVFIDILNKYDFIKNNYPFYNKYIDESITRVLNIVIQYRYNYINDPKKALNEDIKYGFVFQNEYFEILKEATKYNILDKIKKCIVLLEKTKN